MKVRYYFPDNDDLEPIDCIVEEDPPPPPIANKTLSIEISLKSSPEILSQFEYFIREDEARARKAKIQAINASLLAHFLRGSRRSRRRHRTLIKRLARVVRHPGLGIACILNHAKVLEKTDA